MLRGAPAHPDLLVLPALLAHTAVHVGRIGAVLEVFRRAAVKAASSASAIPHRSWLGPTPD